MRGATDASTKAGREPIFGDPRGSLVVSVALTLVSLVVFEFLAFGGALTGAFGVIDSIRVKSRPLLLIGNTCAFVGGFAASVAFRVSS